MKFNYVSKARQAIKYLVEDGRYDYIETGSLLSIRKNNEGILIPSEETRITMYPLDYEEFLMAIGETNTINLIKYSYDNLKPFGRCGQSGDDASVQAIYACGGCHKLSTPISTPIIWLPLMLLNVR